MDLAAATGNISRGRTSLIDYLRSLSGVSDFAVFCWDDLLPALLEIPLVVFGRLWLSVKNTLRKQNRGVN
jgi:predicted ATP-grasp superfamily ATP-dependent carboligase